MGDGVDTLRACECPINEGQTEKLNLEVFIVMDDVWGVLCHNCGALGYHATTEAEAIKKWNAGELQREIGYFYAGGGYEKRMREHGKLIAECHILSDVELDETFGRQGGSDGLRREL